MELVVALGVYHPSRNSDPRARTHEVGQLYLSIIICLRNKRCECRGGLQSRNNGRVVETLGSKYLVTSPGWYLFLVPIYPRDMG